MANEKKLVHGVGNPNADVFIVGEAPGAQEEYHGVPFYGASGRFLNDMLHDAGIDRQACFVSNVCHERPPDNEIELFFANKTVAKKNGLLDIYGKFPLAPVLRGMEFLREEIERVNPRIIIACGNVALWALTGRYNTRSNSVSPTGIYNWRGSQMESLPMWGGRKVVPILHPAAVMRTLDDRWYTILDLQRAAQGAGYAGRWRQPDKSFLLRPSFAETIEFLDALLADLDKRVVRVAVDIETRLGHIACIGFATSADFAICIPFMCIERPMGYWSRVEEIEVVWRITQIFQHRNLICIGQNFNYDSQYIARSWGVRRPAHIDTMLRQHIIIPGTPKGLDFLSSIYCDFHFFWKEEGKLWDPRLHDEDTYWAYNCKDAVTTFEVADKQEAVLDDPMMPKRELEQQFMRKVWPVLRMEIEGLPLDLGRRANLADEARRYITECGEFLEYVIPESVWPRLKGRSTWYTSAQQTAAVFYDVLRQPVQYAARGKGKERTRSVDDDSLQKIGDYEPLLKPICDMILELRSFKVLLANFLECRLDWDNKFRSTLNIGGPETFRWSTSEDAFGFGGNQQNLTKGDE